MIFFNAKNLIIEQKNNKNLFIFLLLKNSRLFY
jgi:hypothetical protein